MRAAIDRKKLRCERKGHKWTIRVRKGFITECGGLLSYRCVADRVTQKRQECRRCGKATEWETTYRSCLQGLTVDPHIHERLFGEGEWWQ